MSALPASTTVPPATANAHLMAAAHWLAPAIASAADVIEADRRLPGVLVRRLRDAGLFRMLAPRRLGGFETDPVTALRVVEHVARADGSTGWLLLANAGGLLTGFLHPTAARAIFAGPDTVIAGALIPSGTATVVDGGYCVNGRWGYASGIDHSTWMMLGCIVADPSAGNTDTVPVMRTVYLPTADLDVIDTWHVTGLRGTGSHDVVARDVFVPAECTFTLLDTPFESGPLYRFPLRGLGACLIAAVALGIARGAVDALNDLAAAKTPTFSAARLSERPYVQMQLAKAEATVRAARSYLYDTVCEVWEDVVADRPTDLRHPALLRLAATHVCASAVEAVDIAHVVAGGAAIHSGTPIERAFRDVHTTVAHFSVQPPTYEQVGRALLGLASLPGPPL